MKQMRWIGVVLAVVLLLSTVPMTAAAKEVTVAIAGLNCARDAGKIVVYTEEYGDTTGTNRWGAEAVVGKDHRVSNIVSGDAAIPEGGFVVSGHDNEEEGGKLMKTWIYENIEIGDYVYVDRRTLTLTVSDAPLTQDVSPFYSFDNPADGVNKSRGEDEMIIYTPERGATTGTNEYGYEVVVRNGVITDMGGNNSVIPSNGYVISMHGATAKWMRSKILKGMTVDFDEQTMNVVFTYNAEGLQAAVEYSLDAAYKTANEAKEAFVYADHDAAKQAIDALSEEYQTALATYRDDGDDLAFADACDRLMAETQDACNILCDSYTVQYRGVWIRPSQKTAADVKAYVKELHDAHINFVSIEGWFENGVIMNVPEDSLFGRHPSFNYDVLQAYIDACHEYGMECHLWMPIMNIGSSIDNGYDERTVTGKKPEWLSLNQKGMPYNKDGFMMIDPANEEAREYLIDFYRYIVTTYDIDAFEMDYIRYYAATGDEDYGYTQAAFDGFEKAYGYGVTPTYDQGASYWKDWCQYRRDCITTWVREIRTMLDREAPDVILAADVAFPFEHALDRVYQDFPSWLEEGLVDVLHPMAYGDGYGEEIRQAIQLGGDTCMVVTGLGVQTDSLGAAEMERQAREDNSYGTYGDCFFEARSFFADKAPAALMKTVYRNEAIPPFLDKDASIRAALDYLVGHIDDVILPLGGMTQEESGAIKAAVTAAKDSVADARMDTAALQTLREAVSAVANVTARQALEADLYRVEQIVCVAHHLSAAQLTDDAAYAASSDTPFSFGYLLPILAAVVIAAAAVITAVCVRRKKTAA